MMEESASDHDTSVPSLMMNTSSCERDELREPSYDADHEGSSDDCRGDQLALYVVDSLFTHSFTVSLCVHALCYTMLLSLMSCCIIIELKQLLV